MKFKKFYFFILIFLITLLFYGCKKIETVLIKDIEEILDSFSNSKNIDLIFWLNIETDRSSESAETRIIMKEENNTPKYFIETKSNEEIAQVYYINGYLCTIMNNQYNISKMDYYNIENNPMDLDLDYDNLNYQINARQDKTTLTYIITIEDRSLKEFVEEIIGYTLSDMEFSMLIEVNVNKKTKALEEINYDISMKNEQININIEMVLEIVAINEDVNLFVPSVVNQKIDDFIQLHKPPSEHEQFDDYIDTKDGVVKYYNMNYYRKILYDAKTNQILVLDSKKISIYNANTMEYIRDIDPNSNPVSMDVENGKLVVGLDTYYFLIHDLENKISDKYITTKIKTSDIAIDRNIVIYSDWDPSILNNIHFYNLNNAQVVETRYYRPFLTMNHKDHILYIAETGSSSSKMIYYNTENSVIIFQTEFNYVINQIYFDGKYVHHEGKTYNPIDGTVVSSSNLIRNYPMYEGFSPYYTKYESDRFSFVHSIDIQKRLAIYDNYYNRYVYKFPFFCNGVIELNNGKYIALDNSSKYIAVVDVNKLDLNRG